MKRDFDGWPSLPRRIGERLQPEAVTDAWYEQKCPPRADLSGLSRMVRLRWRVACALRGCHV